MFQSLRANQHFYILTKGATPRLDIGTVTSVTAPQIKFQAIPQGLGQQPEYVVDVAVTVNGATQQYQRLPANKEIADFGDGYGNIVVSMSRDAMNNEISTLKNKSEDHIRRVEEEKQKIVAYEAILQQLNPSEQPCQAAKLMLSSAPSGETKERASQSTPSAISKDFRPP